MLRGAGLVRLKPTASLACATALSLVTEAEVVHMLHLSSQAQSSICKASNHRAHPPRQQWLCPARSQLESARKSSRTATGSCPASAQKMLGRNCSSPRPPPLPQAHPSSPPSCPQHRQQLRRHRHRRRRLQQKRTASGVHSSTSTEILCGMSVATTPDATRLPMLLDCQLLSSGVLKHIPRARTKRRMHPTHRTHRCRQAREFTAGCRYGTTASRD